MKRVKSKLIFLSILFLCGFFLISCLGCSKSKSKERKKQNPEIIAKEASQGVGVVQKVSEGSEGAPILVLEENHATRAGQIQHAITLVRLHDHNGLKHIALEGYLKGSPEIKTDWFDSAAKGLDFSDKFNVAIRFIKEGEISSAEFMKLVYNDITLHPIEKSEEYTMEMKREDYFAPYFYLLRIAEQSLNQEHFTKLEQLKKDFDSAEQKNNTALQEQKRKEMFDYILSRDSWAQDKARILQDTKAMSSMPEEQIISLTEEIVNRAESLSIKFNTDEKNAIDRYLAFFRGRLKASETMAISTGKIADRPDVSLVVLVVGAAHTNSVCSLFKKKIDHLL